MLPSTRSGLIVAFPRSAGMGGATLLLPSSRYAEGQQPLGYHHACAPGTPASSIGALDSGWLAARPAGAILLTRAAHGFGEAPPNGARTGSEKYHLWMIETAYGQDGPEVVQGVVYVTKLSPIRQYGHGHPAPRRFRSLWRRDPSFCYRKLGGVTSPFEIPAVAAIIATPFCEETCLTTRGDATAEARYFYFNDSEFETAASARSRFARPVEIQPPSETRVSGHVRACQLDENDARSVPLLRSSFEALGSSWADAPSVAPVDASEAPASSWPRSGFASTYSLSDVEAAGFAVPGVGAVGEEESATPHPYSAAALAEAGEATRENELASAWGTTVFSDEAWEANVRARRRYADEYPYRYTVEYS